MRNILATALLLLAPGVWLPVYFFHPDMTGTRLALTFWPLLLFSMLCVVAALVIGGLRR